MEPTSKRSSQGQTIANVIVVPSLVQTAASGPSIGTPKDEEFLNREGRCESKLATADEQRGEIDSYLRDIRHRIEACTGGNRAYYKEAERRWEARQNCYHQSQQRLDRLEHLVRQATNQRIRLTDMYRYREEENSMYDVV